MRRSPTTRDISWFLDMKEREQLNLDPPYQRRSVWSANDKRFFVDTILNGYPAPPVFLHKEIDDDGRATYHVVDGRQRLETIFEFVLGNVKLPSDFSEPSMQGKCWDDLDSEFRSKYWNYEIIVDMIPDVKDDKLIRDIFDRINRNSRTLSRQEMRHAKYDGWFIGVVEKEAEKKEWEDFKIATPGRSKRMLDVQFISELYAVILRKGISSFKQNDMDKLYADFDDIDVEDNADFVDDSCSKFEHIKSIIKNLYELDPSVREYLKYNIHFYTLWSYLYYSLGNLIEEKTLISRYMRFMNEVSERKGSDSDDADNAAEITDSSIFPDDVVADYAKNVTGANTDLPPRQKRLNALTKALAQEE